MTVESFGGMRGAQLSPEIAELKRVLETMLVRIETGVDIRSHLEQIEQLHERLSATAPKMLRHYLERRSYAKALELLNTL